MFRNSFIAGLLIGLGVIINALSDIPYIGSLLFSFGLLIIIFLQIPLFTGRIGFLKETIKNFFIILIGNLIGVAACVYCYTLANSSFFNLLQEKALLKFDKSILQFLIYGIFCGMLIHFAVKSKKELFTCFAIMIFILIGAEHCIAAFPFLLASFSLLNLIKFLMIVVGNSLGAIFIEKMLKKEEKKL